MATLALEKLFNDVKTSMALAAPDGVSLPASNHYFGWREPSKQLKRQATPTVAPNTAITRYIEWVPGDDGDAGAIDPARYPGGNTRPLMTWDETFTVYISAEDPTARTNEFAQWFVTRTLADGWLRAVYKAAHGTYTINKMEWVTEKNEHRFGATLRVVGGIQSKVADETFATAPVDTHAEVTPTLINPPGTGTDDIILVIQPDP